MRLFQRFFASVSPVKRTYDRAVAAAASGDLLTAFQLYTDVVGMKESGSEFVAMALVNRALVCSRLKEFEQARTDLQSVLSMPHAPREMKAEAKARLIRIDAKAARRQPSTATEDRMR